jgi:predicted AlkP superfamily pyrophosphatase or phosphodiesterase
MRFYLFFCLSFIFSVPAFAQAPERPRLVVGIVVDQMRYEYLYRFYDDFEENGLRRMIDKGAVFHSAHYNYAPTNTAPGHASVYAGGPPSLHGIVDND